MSKIDTKNVVIKRYDPAQLEQLAKDQTAIYNQGTAKMPEYPQAKVEDVINRFKRKEFDPLRMFYAYNGSTMIGYAGLSGKDKEKNLRSVGYPWLLKDVPNSVRDLLYDAMENQCKSEGTKTLRTMLLQKYPDLLNFFKARNFQTKLEFLIFEKELTKNVYKLPAGYTFRSLAKNDLSKLESLSRRDPKLKAPFNVSDMERFMNSSDYNPEFALVAEKAGTIVGFYSLTVFPDPKMTKVYFGGVATDPGNQEIELLLLMELENRALSHGKKTIEITFFPDSLRLPSAKERGFKQISSSYRLEKTL